VIPQLKKAILGTQGEVAQYIPYRVDEELSSKDILDELRAQPHMAPLADYISSDRKLYLIDDDCGAVAHLLLTALKKLALEAGHTVISCNCPMDPDNKLEHLLVPTAGIGFLTSNHFHPMENCAAQRKIHARRFQNQELMNSRKTRFLYNRKAAQVLLEQAIVLLKERSQLHDELERFYISAMDFGALNQRYPRLMKLILDYSHKNEQ